MGILEDSKQEFLTAKNQTSAPWEQEELYQGIYKELCQQTRPSPEKLERRVR